MTTAPSRTAAATAAIARAYGVGRQVTAGEVDLAALLLVLDTEHEDLRRAVAPLRIERLLRYVPGIGDRTVGLICRRADVDRGIRVGALPTTARRRLVAELQRFDRAAYRGSGPLRPITTRETR